MKWKVWITMIAALCACSKEEKAKNSTCGVTGASVECACPGGVKGAQTCQADGTFAPCVCPETGLSKVEQPKPEQTTKPAAATPSEASANHSCDFSGRWQVDDQVFEIILDERGKPRMGDEWENEDVELRTDESGTGCAVEIVIVRDEVAAGSGDFTRMAYKLREHRGKVTGVLDMCDFGGDPPDGDLGKIACPEDRVSSTKIEGHRKPLRQR